MDAQTIWPKHSVDLGISTFIAETETRHELHEVVHQQCLSYFESVQLWFRYALNMLRKRDSVRTCCGISAF